MRKRLLRNSTPLLLAAAAVVGVAAVGLGPNRARGWTGDEPAPDKKATGNRRPQDVKFTKDGKLIRPTAYRRWIYVGTPLTPHDMNGGKAPFPEFHAVYINPGSYDHYRRTGEFPDGTVLVKELISVGSKRATSGKGYFMGEFIGLEVSVKDKKRFKEAPGNWAYFSFGKYPLKKSAPAHASTSCNACHGGAADDDYVFTQYYPVLRAAAASAKSSGK